MTRLLFLTALAAVATTASAAQAQSLPPTVPPPSPGVPPFDPLRYQLDRHRYEIDAQRARAEEQQALAAQMTAEARLTVLDLQAQRTPPLTLAPSPRPLRPMEQEAAARRAATARREAVQQGVGQIDAWLDRAR